MMMRAGLVSVALFAIACGVSEDGAVDGEFDRFVSGDGKSDTGGIQEGTDDALGVLHVVNTLSEAQLKSQAGLATAAAANIAAYRTGDDEQTGTADDEQFESLRELDTIPFVGAVAFGKLLAYAEAQGFTDDPPAVGATDDPFDDSACQGAPMSQAAAMARLQAHQGVLGSYQMQMRQRSCSGSGASMTCGAWHPYDLSQVSWRTTASGMLELGNYSGQVKLQTKHDLCYEYGAYIQPASYIVGSVCDGVGHTLYCGTYGYPKACQAGYDHSGVEPYELPNGFSFALEGKVTENCAQLKKSTRTSFGNEIEVGLLVRF